MKKILIATWCNNNGKTNYGQVLQAYALQKYLCDLDYQVEIINYINLVQPEKNSTRVKAFKKFVKRNIILTKVYRDIKELNEGLSDVDVLIAGSDQIWNPASLNNVYLLEFGKESIKRVSYASSGIFYEDEKNKNEIKHMADVLESYHAISVREEISASILDRYLTKKPEVVCDPVLLLCGDEWLKISKAVKIPEKYILCYVFGGIRNIQAILENYRIAFNAEKIVVISSNWFEEKISWKRIKYIDWSGPSEFISLIEKSEAVVTDSFHGTAFSVIFKKQFINIIRYNENSNPHATGDRINNLLHQIGIESRKVFNVAELENKNMIDYEGVEERLNTFITESEKYLINAIVR